MNATFMPPVARPDITSICQYRTLALEKRAEANAVLARAYEIGREADKLAGAAHKGRRFYAADGRESSPFKAMYQRDGFDPDKSLEAYRKELDRGIWTYLLDTTGLRDLMDREAIKQLEDSLATDVVEATEDNVRATVEQLIGDADMIFKRGLANAFAGLDRRFRSHDGFKIGSRLIFTYAFDSDTGHVSWGGTWDKIADVERVMSVLDGRGGKEVGQLRAACDRDRRGQYRPQQSETETAYFRLKGYKNGNAHMWFTRDDLVEQANKMLAEVYGDVLPDAYTAKDDGNDLFSKSRAVSKDLQFYPSPPAVVAELIDGLGLEGKRVLEPSAGQGAIALTAAAGGARVDAIEVDPRHLDVLAGEARRRGLSGITTRQGNFLQTTARPIYDLVLMNPPFYGTHWMEHVRHAFEFLATGGILRAVLPVSAEVNETPRHEKFRSWAKPFYDYGWRGGWKDLPERSFSESGTDINTVILHLRKR